MQESVMCNNLVRNELEDHIVGHNFQESSLQQVERHLEYKE
jgi:hypothetical protein